MCTYHYTILPAYIHLGIMCMGRDPGAAVDAACLQS